MQSKARRRPCLRLLLLAAVMLLLAAAAEGSEGSAPSERDLIVDYTTSSTTSSSQPSGVCNPTAERAFLLVFYNSTRGRGWLSSGTGNATWAGTMSQCLWFGVGCGPDSCVTSLHLPSNGLVGPLPGVFGLPFLQSLLLTTNYLTGTVPPSLFSLQSLQTLDLSNNDFVGQLPSLGIFAYGANLTTLLLYNNRLSGPLPGALNMAISLQVLKLYRNSFNGSLPSLQLCNALSVVDLSFNVLSGVIPSTYGTLSNLKVLNLSSNDLVGGLPDTFGNLTQLQVLTLSGNNFTGPLPSFLYQINPLIWLDLSANQFSGTLSGLYPSHGKAFKLLRYFSLSQNMLTGVIPPWFLASLSAQIEYIDLSYNLLTGTIPPLPSQMNTLFLASLNLCCQNLSGPIPSFANTVPALNFLDLSSNELTGTLEPLGALANKPAVLINLAHNNITGPFSEVNALFAAQSEAVSNLRVLYLGSNSITGTVSSFLCTANNLILIDLSDNALSSIIPDCMADMQFLKAVDFTGNTKMRGALGPTGLPQVPKFLKKNADVRVYSSVGTSTFTCPSFVSAPPSEATFSIPPTYYDYQLCSCDAGYYGVGSSCVECSRALICNGGDTFEITDGFWMSPNPYTLTAGVVPCQNASLLVSPCLAVTVNYSDPSPYGVNGFPCATGYRSRLCSQCDVGYFPRGPQCVVCHRSLTYLLPFGYILLLALVTYLCYYMAGEAASQRSIITIFVVYLQSAALYKGVVSIAWSTPLLVFFQLLAPSNFELPAFSCLFPGHTDQSFLIGTLLQPLIFVGSALLVFFVGLLWRVAIPAGSDSVRSRVSRWLRRCAYVLLFFLNLNYTNVARQVMIVLNCSEDSVTGRSYVAAYPFMDCASEEHNRLVAISFAFVVVYLFGVPLLFTALIIRNRNELKLPTMYTLLGFAYKCYKSQFYWWELVIFLRRVLLVICLFSPAHKSFISPLLTVVLFQFAILVQIKVRPYNTTSQNFVEILSLYVLQGTYIVGLIVQVPWVAAQGGELICTMVLVANILIMLYYAFLLALNNTSFATFVRDSAARSRRRRLRLANYVSALIGAPRSNVIQQTEFEDGAGGDYADEPERAPMLEPDDIDAANFVLFPQRMPAGTNMFLS